MIPVLYKSNEVDFNHNGLGLLSETIECTVTEERNGLFELFLEYPVSGRLYEEIKDFVIIKAKPNRLDEEDHLFRVYDYEMDMESQTVLVYAHSKTNDLAGNMVLSAEIENKTAQEALDIMKASLIEPTDYLFHSDITTRTSTTWERRNPLNCIVGEEGSLVQYWGGEIKRRNEIIHLYRRRGNDNVTTIRHGKNLTGLRAIYSTKGLVTQILPVCTYIDEETNEEVTLIGDVVESQYVNNYPIKMIREVDYSQYDAIENLEDLNNKASLYFEENPGIDLPRVKMEVDMDDLSDSPEYEKFKDLERIELTDTVTVYAKKFDVNITAKVNKMTFDVLTEKVRSLEIGSVQTRLFDDINKNIHDEIKKVNEKVNKEIETVYLAANNKNKVYRSSEMPETGVRNDIWYKPVGDGEVEMYIHDGADWVLEVYSAGQLGGTFNAANVNVINLNGHSMTTGILRGGKVDFDLDNGTFLIGDNTVNYDLYFDGSSLSLGKNVVISWDAEDVGARPDDWVPTWTEIQNKPDIPTVPAYITATKITQTTIESPTITGGDVYLRNSSGNINAGMSSSGTASTSIRMWAGSTYDNRASAPFRVQQNGKMIATNAEITGKITADTGQIGIFEIKPGEIEAKDYVQNWHLRIGAPAIGGGKSPLWLGTLDGLINDKAMIYPDGTIQTFARLRSNDILPNSGSGTIGATNNRFDYIYLYNQPNVSSDVRQKNSIQDIPEGLIEKLKDLEPKMFKHNGDENGLWHFGYIAQDVETVLYQYALEEVGYEDAQEYVKDFAFLHKDESYLSLLYGEIAVLREKEMRDRIASLELQIEELKGV